MIEILKNLLPCGNNKISPASYNDDDPTSTTDSTRAVIGDPLSSVSDVSDDEDLTAQSDTTPTDPPSCCCIS